jgi:iron complex transport system ATP-binding protein
MNGNVLSCHGLAVGYKKNVLSDINLEFQAGQFVALLGSNGVGKTTLLRTISRHLKPLAGQVEVMGRPLEELSSLELARTMAVVLTDKAAPPLFTVREFAALGRYPYTGFMGKLTADDEKVVARALTYVRAENLADRYVDQLSDGERQKAVLARALAQEPAIMVLDEPTAFLDLKHRMEVMDILKRLCHSGNLTAVASLHDVDIAAKVADKVVMVKNGRVVDYGLPEKVLTTDSVTELYDFQEARFCGSLGGIELKSDGRSGRVLVLAGSGEGASILRLLAKRGFAPLLAGASEGSVEMHVARSLGAEIFEAASPQSVSRVLEGCALAVDCGLTPSTPGEDSPAALFRKAAREMGRPFFAPFQVEAGGRGGLNSLIEFLETLKARSAA